MLKNIIFIFTVILLSTCIYAQETVLCRKVINGNTITVDTGKKIRLIGVDTPEPANPLKGTEYFTKESALFTKKLVEGKKIRLEFEKNSPDISGSLPAYVYLNETFVNAEIIKQGYGFVNDKDEFKYLNDFRGYENTAKEKELGLWKGKGEFEFIWLLKKGIKPMKVYAMANKLWGIEYKNFIKPRVKPEDLSSELQNLEEWANKYTKTDLTNVLLKNGWIQK